MMMVTHAQLARLWGDLPLPALEIGTHQSVHHLDQRGGPDQGVELGAHQRFEGVKLVAQEPGGARQPAGSFFLRVPLGLRPRLVAERLMVPRQHETISGLVGSHATECSRHRCGVGERDDQGLDRLAKGWERGGNGGPVQLLEHIAKAPQCRVHVCWGAPSPLGRAYVEGFTQQGEQ